jgi:FkbM family methyltransferase
MIKKISYLIFKLIFFLNYLLEKFLKKNILIYFKEFLEENSYKTIFICKKQIIFFTPNFITKWRVDSFYTKEPETLEWIDKFDDKKKIVFWDIGANIGLYSIYAASKFENIEVTAFEPSTSNLRILSRNISKNNLSSKIRINQFPLTNQKNKFLEMQELEFIEGWSMNSFGENIDFEGKTFMPKNKYRVYGTSIDYLLENNILEIPNYIKIDVDGIEHLILEGGKSFLKDKKIKSISVELNEKFVAQYNEVMNIMKSSNFYLKHKKHSDELEKSVKFSRLYNFVFEKK